MDEVTAGWKRTGYQDVVVMMGEARTAHVGTTDANNNFVIKLETTRKICEQMG